MIYDTMTVAENLPSPAQPQGAGDADQTARGRDRRMLEMSGQLDQRAAGLRRMPNRRSRWAAAWCAPDVAAVLFDEPLTVIDPHLKWQLRRSSSRSTTSSSSR